MTDLGVEPLQGFLSEVRGQPRKLSEYERAALPSANAGSIFVGAGDSFAAALVGFYASKGRCLALDPYTLASEPDMARGVEVFFISVSGKTSANLLALSKVKRIAQRTVAITAVRDSPLADEVDQVLGLPFDYVPRSPGLSSFCLSSLAVMKLVRAPGSPDFQRAFKEAKADCRRLSRPRGIAYILGNALAYAASLYASAKVYEFLGSRAHAEVLEEFSHMELFSLGSSDAVNIFSAFDPERVSEKLHKALLREGFSSAIVPSGGHSSMEDFFHCAFVSQLWCLAEAKKSGLAGPRFLSRSRGMRVSDSMIY